VIEYDLGKQVDLFQGVRKWLAGDEKGGSRRGGGAWEWAVEHRTPLVGGGALGGVLASLLWRRRRGVAAGVTSRPQSRRSREVKGAFDRATRAIERRTTPRAVGETPRELAVRAAVRGDPGAAAYSELVLLYYASRFGAQAVDQARVEALAAAVVKPPQPRASELSVEKPPLRPN
jgi:hypothetical protein